MQAWLDWLLDASQFTTRDRCGPGWTPALVTVHQLAEASIFFAYLVIPPLAWIRFQQGFFSSPSLRGLRVFLAFLALFVVSCGATHFMGRLSFVWPAYRFGAFVLTVCALASWGTVWTLLTLRKGSA